MRYAAVLGTLAVLVALSAQVEPALPKGTATVPIFAKPTSPTIDPGWLAKAVEGIEKSEYQFTRARDGGWGAPNRAHDLRTTVDREGMRLTALTRDASRWSFGLQVTRFGRSGRLITPEPPTVSAGEGRAQLAHGQWLTEWYVNDHRGLEHGFTIRSRPDGNPNRSDVIIEMRAHGGLRSEVVPDGTAIQWHDARDDDRVVLSYAGLQVRDAAGRALRAGLRLASTRIQIWFDDAGAIYPVEVDPILTTPEWKVTGLSAADVRSAGDVNGDGKDDIIVGVPDYFDPAGVEYRGRAFLYFGGPNGPTNPPAPNWTGQVTNNLGDGGFGNYGSSVAGVGRVDDDIYDDIVVGASGFDTASLSSAGAVFFYKGGPSGPSESPVSTVYGTQTFSQFGLNVGGVGDVDNDGHNDVVVGETHHTFNGGPGGAAYVFFGSQSGIGNGRALNGTPNTVYFGTTVAICNVNGDEYGDVLAGDPVSQVNGSQTYGQVAVYWGSESPTYEAPNQIITETQVRVGLGNGLSCGDVNRDGFDDAIIANPTFGVVHAYLGSSNGLGSEAWTVVGKAAAYAGDVNKDSFGDAIVGDYTFTGGQVNEGHILLFLGTPDGLSGAPIWSTESNIFNGLLGLPVSAAGDVNGDGYKDMLAGAPGDSGGAVSLFLGGSTNDIIDPLCNTAKECPGAYVDSVAGNVVHLKSPEDLAHAPVRRTGTTTDGTSRLLLRMTVDQAVTFSLKAGDGTLLGNSWGTLQLADGSNEGASVTASLETTSLGQMVFAVYRPPDTFPGPSDPQSISQGVSVRVEAAWGGNTENVYIQLYPPPVVLVHGLWSGFGAWQGLADQLRPAGFEVSRVEYGKRQPAPEFDPVKTSMTDSYAIRQLSDMAQYARDARRNRDIAISQVDVVAHSLGGLITRARVAWRGRPYRDIDNYNGGEFHRLITVGTPHFGTNLADFLVQHQCDLFQAGDTTVPLSLKSFMTLIDKPIGDGVLGLRVNSPALHNIGQTQVPTFTIAARAGSNSLTEAALNTLAFLTGNGSSNVDNLLDIEGNHDTIVAQPSQTGGSTATSTFFGIVHTDLFAGDTSETESTEISNEIKIALLLPQITLTGTMPAPTSTGNAAPQPTCGLGPPGTGPLSGTVTLTPPPLTVVQPGQALTVSLTIDGGNSVDGALFAVGDTLQVFEGPGPFSFQYVVPSGRAGAISMRADTFGPGPENYTATSSLQVNETGPATSLVVQPPSTTLVQIGELFQILVTAKQANGTLTDVTDAEAGTTYTMQSGGSAIASVSSSGVVEANGAGQDTVIVNHGSLQAVIPVKVVITNHSPVIQAVTDVTMPPGASLDVPISVTDTDGDALQIDRMAGPAFAQVVDLGGGAAQLQLRPGVTDVGTFSVAIGATDNGTPPFGTATSARITVCNCGDQGCVVSPGIPEVCNGLDDNCSGQTDEGLGFTSCGLGACLHWTYNCANGEPQECEPGPPSTEVCNGVDDNCNGQTDEGFTDTDGDGIKNCIDPDDDNDGDPDSADCASLNAAVHHGATEGPACNITCSDGLDNDCDGATDTADLAGCPKPPSADYSTGPGTKIAGSYVSTVISDNVREGFREGLQNNKSKLSHVWRFDNILAGSSHELVVEGYRPNNTEGDNFKFGFNTAPGPLFMVIDNAVINASVETMASYPFSGAVSGTIYVLLDDTVGSGGQLDTVYIDCLAIRTLP